MSSFDFGDAPPQLRVKRLVPEAILPTRGTYGSAGLDLYSTHDLYLRPEYRAHVQTGIAVEIPDGYVGDIRPRSSLSKQGVHCYYGTIDSDYRGEILVILHNLGSERIDLKAGSRIAQLVLVTSPRFLVVEAEELSNTVRGSNGFGSTGV